MHLFTPLISFNWTLLMIWVTVIVLFFILKKNFFEKVHNFVADREAMIKDAFENAELTNKQADEKLLDYQKQIEQIEEEGREIIKNAKIRADAQAKSILSEANNKANELRLQAEREIEREKLKAVNEMKQQIASLAIYAAEKIMEKQLEEAGQNEIIEKIIEQAGRSAWQN